MRATLAVLLLVLAPLALAPTPQAAHAEATWPALADAKVRPGVQVTGPAGQCTSNFVYTTPGSASLYLGLAAHCVQGMALGERLDVANGAALGRLAYSSWLTMAEAGEQDATTLANNDFALVRIDDAHRHLVHPAVLHFGGPTGLADATTLETGDGVLTYGNSGLRLRLAPLSPHEGYVVTRADSWHTFVLTATPGVPGDSGSGVMTRDGRAFGVLVTLNVVPPGMNGVTHLDKALAYARAHAGIDARLATWDLLAAPLLPPT